MKLKLALTGILVAACALVQAAQMPKEINIAYVKSLQSAKYGDEGSGAS